MLLKQIIFSFSLWSTTIEESFFKQMNNQTSFMALEVIQGMRKAMIVKSFMELNIAGLLQESQMEVEELAKATETQPDALYRFLRSAAACQLLVEYSTTNGKRFGLSDLGRALCPGQLQASLLKYSLADFEIDSWQCLNDTLRTGKRAVDQVLGMSFWDYLEQHPEVNDDFNGCMTALTAPVLLPMAKAYPDFSQVSTVMDVGGGEGTFLLTMLQEYPHLQGILFDREQVISKAQAHITEAGLNERCRCIAGSFFESIPGGAQVYTFKNVFHDWDDGQVLAILQNVRSASPEGTRVLIAELLLAEQEPSFAVTALDLHMLLETGGRQRTAGDFELILRQAGFALQRVMPVGRTPYSLVEAVAV